VFPCVCGREGECLCVFVCVSVCEREGVFCVCEREREIDCVFECEWV